MDKKLWMWSMVLALVASSCKTVFEEDITNEEIDLLYPADGFTATSQSVLFGWEELEEAGEYQIQIAQPSFEAPEVFLVDSMLEQETFSQFLAEGSWKWRVRGVNAASATAWTERSLDVLTGNGISDLQAEAENPMNGLVTNSDQVVFSWQSLEGADSYLLRVYEDDNGNLGSIVHESVGEGLSEAVVLGEGVFLWHVAGLNGTSGTSQYSALRDLEVDLTNPTAPALSLPETGEVISDLTYTFDWTSGSDVNLAFDSIYVFQDGLALPVIANQISGSSIELDLSNNPIGTYQWRVVSIDLAGNSSTSGLRQFFLE